MKNNTQELEILFANLKKRSTKLELTTLHQPIPVDSVIAFATDWILIGISLFIATKGWPLAILSIVIIGSRQRALSNLVHDASHRNLFSSPRMNDFIANILSAYPMFETVNAYRKSHLMHHRFLGDLSKDPDSNSHLRYGFDDRNPPQKRGIYFSLLRNNRAWCDSVMGNWPQLTRKDKSSIFIWWVLLATASLTFCGPTTTALFFGLWIVSRATTYHAIRIFAEFLDHTGLNSETILRFTRNLPHQGFWSALFHPHQDTYHLAHHVFMSIPHYRLREAHALLMRSDLYRNAHHCDSYFKGDHSAIACWQGNCGEISR